MKKIIINLIILILIASCSNDSNVTESAISQDATYSDYLLTDFYNATVRLGDLLVIIGALFWSLHIIFIAKVIDKFDIPIFIGIVQTLVVSLFSIILALVFEEFVFSNILAQKMQILYAGILSAGIAFVLQIYAQKNITPAPAAIIFSLEGVIATLAAWILLSQYLNINNLFGCLFILIGVLFSQLAPEFKKINLKLSKKL